jgi:branched-chain amino acid transport system permease protein
MNKLSWRFFIALAVLIGLALVPVYVQLTGATFSLTLFGRIMIYAIAATSLNILIGYVGLVSFGHALYFMLGAYAVSLMQFHGFNNGWAHLAVAIGASALVAVATGWVCLRTSGMGFIMITLAFAQMFFFLGISLKEYGGDDGMRLDLRSALAPFDLAKGEQLYLIIFLFLLFTLWLKWRLTESRFGYVLRGVKSNERRMTALGYSVMKYKLGAIVVAAVICAVAGFLLANLTRYTSPAYGTWSISGELIVIVVLGGMGTLFGPLVGAIAFLLFEEFLTSSSIPWVAQHWQLIMGGAIVLIVLVAKRGLYGSLPGSSSKGAAP